jgi:hypothetical protein
VYRVFCCHDKACAKKGDVIDLTSRPTVSAANDASVRRVLTPLGRLADKYDCVIIMFAT